MNKVELLDCTLRDGAYIVDKKFGDQVIHNIVKGLEAAKIDIIEIGFLQNEGQGEGKTVFFNSVDAEKLVDVNRNTSYAVLADYSRYTISNLDEYTGKSFDTVRACFFKRERKDVISFCKTIKEKGYKVFVQPVDILGYSDYELLDLLSDINQIEPYCFSIVDTFGSMYEEDLQRVFSIIHHNLISTSKVGFHSHNNLQMSSALSQSFIKMSYGKRDVVVDCTLQGMGRGAGNTPTELVVQYMMAKYDKQYNLDAILDVIDSEINEIHAKFEWGYNIPYFIAGNYSSHVNNISYLLKKNSITSKGIRYILNSLMKEQRKRYDYNLLDEKYMEYIEADIDDSNAFQILKNEMKGKEVLVIAPGNSVTREKEKVTAYIEENNPIVIAINFCPAKIAVDYVYMNNAKRYSQKNKFNSEQKMILTSNLQCESTDNETVISIKRLMKCGWQHMDNSAVLLLRLLNQLEVSKVIIAGLDGYDVCVEMNYADTSIQMFNPYDSIYELNDEISSMLEDFMLTKRSALEVQLLTTSRFEKIINRWMDEKK